MNTPENLLYTKEHEWIKIEGDIATIGITDYAQNSLGDIVFVEQPEVGVELAAGKSFGVVESIKSVSDLYAPVTGEVIEINTALTDAPESVNQNAYDAWIIKIRMSSLNEKESLLSPAAYVDFCQNND